METKEKCKYGSISFQDPKVYEDLLRASYLIYMLKMMLPKDRKPEVDHIEPIYKGGHGLSADLSNHQAICYTCHKIKTRIDLKR